MPSIYLQYQNLIKNILSNNKCVFAENYLQTVDITQSSKMHHIHVNKIKFAGKTILEMNDADKEQCAILYGVPISLSMHSTLDAHVT